MVTNYRSLFRETGQQPSGDQLGTQLLRCLCNTLKHIFQAYSLNGLESENRT